MTFNLLLVSLPVNHGLLYSICWEDPEVILEVVNQGDDVLCICSAGDLALTALTKDPNSVTALDSNPTQLDLLKLKMRFYTEFEGDELHTLYGVKPSTRKDREELLSGWKQSEEIVSSIVKYGVLNAGRLERYMRSFARYIMPLCASRRVLRQFLQLQSLVEQEEFYEKHINRFVYRLLFRGFFGRFYMSKKGRHPDLLKHVKADPGAVLINRMKHSWTEVPISKNYFFRLIVNGYLEAEKNLPVWLRKDSLETIKSRLPKLKIEEGSILQIDNSRSERYDVIYLSDVTEVMSREESEKLFDTCYNLLRNGGRLVLWNHTVERRPGSRWKFEQELSTNLWENRIISFYGFLGVFTKNE